MKLIKLNCVACGAPITIPEDSAQFNCSNCGSLLAVQRDPGEVSIKVLKDLSKALDKSSEEIQSAIQSSSQVTKIEMQRMQYKYEITSLESQLANIRSEIRGLERGKAANPKNKKISQNINDLHYNEFTLIERIRNLSTEQAKLGINPLGADINYIKSQISLLSSSIIALGKSGQSTKGSKKQYQSLNSLRSQFEKQLIDAQTNSITAALPSYNFTFSQPPSREQLVAYNNLLDQDIQSTREMGNIPQAPEVIKDLLQKKNNTSQRLSEIERTRVQSLQISSRTTIPKNSDLLLIKTELEHTLTDIDTLAGQPGNQITIKELQRLKKNQKKYQKYINQKEGNTLSAAITAEFTAVITAILVSIGLHKSESSSDIVPMSNTGTNLKIEPQELSTSGDASKEQRISDETISSKGKPLPVDNSEENINLIEKPILAHQRNFLEIPGENTEIPVVKELPSVARQFARVFLGLGIWLFILIVISSCGIITLGGSITEEVSTQQTGFTMLGVLIGYILGAIVFFRLATKEKLHPIARRLFKSITWMLGILIISISTAMIFDTSNPDLSTNIGIFGLICAVPLAGIIVFILDWRYTRILTDHIASKQ